MAGAKTLEQANEYLETKFLAEWNERFTVKAGSDVDAHWPLGKTKRYTWLMTAGAMAPRPGSSIAPMTEIELASVLSHAEQRQVTNDYTVKWEGRWWQIPKEAARAGLRRASIRIEGRLDATVMARIGGGFV